MKNCKLTMFYWQVQGNGLLVGKLKTQKFLKTIHQILKRYARKGDNLLFVTNKAQENDMQFQ